MKIALITVSDRAAAGIYEDRSGPAMKEELLRLLPGSSVTLSLVPDDQKLLMEAFEQQAADGADWILSSGGTGPGPRDYSPECARIFCDRSVPGLAEYLRMESLKQTPNAVFSRLYAGLHHSCFVVCLPGSERAVRFCIRLLAPLMDHGSRMARGEGH